MSAAWRGELRKIATVRWQWLGVILASVALPLTSLVVAATGGLGPHDTATSGAAAGAVVALVAFGAWAAALSAGEYATHTMSVSLATVPRRSHLYSAKLVVLAAVAGSGALLSAAVALVAVRAVSLSAEHRLGDPIALVSVVLVVVAVVFIGAAVGSLTRSPSASMAIVAAVVLGPAAAGGLMGNLQRWIVGASPGTVITQIVGGGQLLADQAYPGGPWLAAMSLVVVSAAVAIAGGLVFLRRDL